MRYFLVLALSFAMQIAESKALCYNLTQEIPCGGAQFPRQAGDFAESEENRFSHVNKDIVLDNKTKLLWLQCINPANCSAQVPMNWENAGQACANIQLEELQWRLPTIIELNSLIDLQAKPQKINITYFANTKAAGYWTDTRSLTYKTLGDRAWYINFSHASIFDAPVISKHFVRCVSQQDK